MKPLRLPADDQLRWLLGSSDQALGLSTAFRDGFTTGGNDYDGAMVRRIELVTQDGRSPKGRPVARLRELRSRYCRLAAVERDVLFAAYGPVAWKELVGDVDPEARNFVDRALGDYVGVALMTKAIGEWVRIACMRPTGHAGPFGTTRGAALLDLCRKRSARLDTVRDQAMGAVTVSLGAWWGIERDPDAPRAEVFCA